MGTIAASKIWGKILSISYFTLDWIQLGWAGVGLLAFIWILVPTYKKKGREAVMQELRDHWGKLAWRASGITFKLALFYFLILCLYHASKEILEQEEIIDSQYQTIELQKENIRKLSSEKEVEAFLVKEVPEIVIKINENYHSSLWVTFPIQINNNSNNPRMVLVSREGFKISKFPEWNVVTDVVANVLTSNQVVDSKIKILGHDNAASSPTFRLDFIYRGKDDFLKEASFLSEEILYRITVKTDRKEKFSLEQKVKLRELIIEQFQIDIASRP